MTSISSLSSSMNNGDTCKLKQPEQKSRAACKLRKQQGVWHLRSIRRQQSSSLLSKRNNVAAVDDIETGKSRWYDLKDQSAAEIFTIDDDNPMDMNRRIYADGHEIEYELQQNVSQKSPEGNGDKQHTVINKNIKPSPIEVRIRLWVLNFSICMICFFYLLLFVLLNTTFAALWMIPKGNCCGVDNPTTFVDNFKFAIYTSTTLGYGDYQPVGWFSETLIVLIIFLSMTLNILFGGVLFLKFVTPSSKIEFSEIITLSNVNGLPCLEMRVGNADGRNMRLVDAEARLNLIYRIQYVDELGTTRTIANTQKLTLLSDWRQELSEVWTLRHVVDETSPLFGVMGTPMEEYIVFIRLSISATQDVSKSHVSASTGYHFDDVLVGHRFQDQMSFDKHCNTIIADYAMMNETVPHPVWYPTKNKNSKILTD